MNVDVHTLIEIGILQNINSISIAKKGKSHVRFQSQKEKVENDIKIIMNNNRIQNI